MTRAARREIVHQGDNDRLNQYVRDNDADLSLRAKRLRDLGKVAGYNWMKHVVAHDVRVVAWIDWGLQFSYDCPRNLAPRRHCKANCQFQMQIGLA